MSATNAKHEGRPEQKWRSYFIKLPYAVIVHPNYLTLSPATQQTLIDIYRQWQRSTNFGLDPLPHDGFPYSYGHCIVDCHRNTFARAMRTLIERNWIAESDQLDIDKEVRWYRLNPNWRKWRPTEKQRKRLVSLKTRIERREANDKSTTCTILVHRPAPQNDNPALKFWARDADYLHCFDATLTFDQKEKGTEGAHARALQLTCQEEPQNREPMTPAEVAAWDAQWGNWREKLTGATVPLAPGDTPDD